jgi:hypothetical protein
MANVFKNYTGSATTAGAGIYTVPTGTTSILLGLSLANTTNTGTYVSVQLGSTYIVKDAPVPTGSSLSAIDGKIIAEAGEVITVTASTDSAIDAIISVMEQS